MQQSHNKPIVAQTPDSIGNHQVNMDVKKFDDFITDKGYECLIERAMRCPCSKDTNSALSDCKNCGGSGWIFIDRRKSIVACTAMSHRNKLETWTMENMGTVNITCRAEDKLGFMDKVTLLELEEWNTEILKTSKSTGANSKLFAFTAYSPEEVFELYKFVESSSPLQFLEKDVDYFVEGNKIVFDPTNHPVLAPFNFSIRYTHMPVYHIIDVNRALVKQRASKTCNSLEVQKANFPLSCIGRKAHIILNAQNYDNTGLFDVTNYNRPAPNYNV